MDKVVSPHLKNVLKFETIKFPFLKGFMEVETVENAVPSQ
jgi:hypothetical protein